MPEFTPSDSDRFVVSRAVGFGLSNKQICQLIKNQRTGRCISEMLIPTHFADEVAAGSGELVYTIATNLVNLALNSDNDMVRLKASEVLLNRRGGPQWKENLHIEQDVNFAVIPNAADLLRAKISRLVGDAQAPQPFHHLQLVNPDDE